MDSLNDSLSIFKDVTSLKPLKPSQKILNLTQSPLTTWRLIAPPLRVIVETAGVTELNVCSESCNSAGTDGRPGSSEQVVNLHATDSTMYGVHEASTATWRSSGVNSDIDDVERCCQERRPVETVLVGDALRPGTVTTALTHVTITSSWCHKILY